MYLSNDLSSLKKMVKQSGSHAPKKPTKNRMAVTSVMYRVKRYANLKLEAFASQTIRYSTCR